MQVTSPLSEAEPPLVAQAIARVRAAVSRWGKLAVAEAAGLRESTLRLADRDGWTPTSETLRKCEEAIPALESLHGPLDAVPSTGIGEAKPT
jgi:hypothetical protein